MTANDAHTCATPALVDGHIHPDKTAWGQPWMSRRPASTLAEIREIARRTIVSGCQGRVTIGHAFALCDATLPSLRDTLDLVAEAGIWVATCGRGPNPVPDIDLFESHGVRLVGDSDGVRDTWSPFGTASMVDRAHLIAYRTGALTDSDLERVFRMCSTNGAEMLGIPELTTWGGPSGDTRLEFVSRSVTEIVVNRRSPGAVFRNGHRI